MRRLADAHLGNKSYKQALTIYHSLDTFVRQACQLDQQGRQLQQERQEHTNEQLRSELQNIRVQMVKCLLGLGEKEAGFSLLSVCGIVYWYCGIVELWNCVLELWNCVMQLWTCIVELCTDIAELCPGIMELCTGLVVEYYGSSLIYRLPQYTRA